MNVAAVVGFIVASPGTTLFSGSMPNNQPNRTANPSPIMAKAANFAMTASPGAALAT